MPNWTRSRMNTYTNSLLSSFSGKISLTIGLLLTFQFNVFVNTEYPNKIHCQKQDKSQRTWPDHDDNHTQEVPAESTKWHQATIVQNSGILVEDGRRQNSPDSTTEMNCAKTKEREGDYEIFYHKYRFHWFCLMRSSAKNWAVKRIRNVALAMTRLTYSSKT